MRKQLTHIVFLILLLSIWVVGHAQFTPSFDLSSDSDAEQADDLPQTDDAAPIAPNETEEADTSVDADLFGPADEAPEESPTESADDIFGPASDEPASDESPDDIFGASDGKADGSDDIFGPASDTPIDESTDDAFGPADEKDDGSDDIFGPATDAANDESTDDIFGTPDDEKADEGDDIFGPATDATNPEIPTVAPEPSVDIEPTVAPEPTMATEEPTLDFNEPSPVETNDGVVPGVPTLADPSLAPADDIIGPSTPPLDPLVEDPTVTDPIVISDNIDGLPLYRKPASWKGRKKFIRTHWVRLSPTGRLRGDINLLRPSGRTRGIGSLNVTIYRDGQVVGNAQTDELGRFEIPNMTSGVYSLIAHGPDGFAAFGLQALAALDKGQSSKLDTSFQFTQSVTATEALRISTAAIPPTFNQLRTVIRERTPSLSSISVPKDAWKELIEAAVLAGAPGADEPEGPEMYRGTKELERNPIDKTPTQRSSILGNYDAPLERHESGWMLRGRLFGIDPVSGRGVEVAARSTTITLIRDDQRVAATECRKEGDFEFYGLTPGIYSLVAVGDGGFGAIAFRAITTDDQARLKQPHIHFVQNLLNAGPPPGGLSVPMMSDPVAIQDAIAICNGLGAPAPPVAPPAPPAASEIVEDAPAPPAAGFPPPPPPVELGAPPPPPAPAFSGTVGNFPSQGSSGGSVLGTGRLIGVAGLAVGVTAVSQSDRAPVSPSRP